MTGWLKAGLIGAAALIVLDLIGLIPIPALACATGLAGLVVYVVVGVLAARWMPALSGGGAGAGYGALAAVLAAIAGGIVYAILLSATTNVAGIDAAINQMPPEMLQQLREAGIDPLAFATSGFALVTGLICCTVGVFFAAVLGALGGAVAGSSRPNLPPANP